MYNLVVIGGGPAGVTAALRARELGANVALVERGRLGGTCTNDGCVPTRVLARAARFMRDARRFAEYGLQAPVPTVDFEQVIRRTQQVVYQLQEKKQLLAHLEEVGITTLDETGDAHFVDAHTIALENGKGIEAEKYVLCVGGRPRRLDLPGGEHALTHSDIWTLKRVPASIVIVGGGATGCQVASIMAAFGAKVTLMDIAPRLLIAEDQAVAETIRSEFGKNGIEIITGIKGLKQIEKQGETLYLSYERNEQLYTRPAEAVLLAVGWPGNVSALDLSAAGVETKGPYIVVNDYMQTSAPHIYAAGDITGRMMLVQSASYQAQVAAENAVAGNTRIVEHRLVPHGGFTDPEYASVGLTEDQARAQYDCAVAVVPYADMDRAVIDGTTEGFCKLIIDRETRTILGAHIVGEQAVEVVQLVSAGMAAGMRVEQLADLELAYPTIAAIVGLAARQLVRQLELVPVSQEWRALKQIPSRGNEWERRE
jgi:pyruvate/2-oxoglutarate dehydrogenase complex dihydrolipoamide dehydrogenase (E3) component